MSVCECICRYKNEHDKFVACDLRFNTGKIITMSWKEFTLALKQETITCINMELTSRGIPHVLKRNTVPIVSKKLTPALAKEVDTFAQSMYLRYKMMRAPTNLEGVFDNFLALKRSQGIVYTPLSQYCIYSYMNDLMSWDVYSYYQEVDGIISLVHTNVSEGIYILRCWVRVLNDEGGEYCSPFPIRMGHLKVINQSQLIRMAGLFSSIFIDYLDLSEFTTEGILDMSYMFFSCKIPELDLRRFNTSKVTTMERMFANCNELIKLDMSSFDTRNVTTMAGMFFNCEKLVNLSLHNFITRNVTTMQLMFKGCDLTSWDISSLDTSNVTDMRNMFILCTIAGAQLQYLNTSSATTLQGMFKLCQFSDGNCILRNFDTRKVTSFAEMFCNCENLKQIDISSFSFDKAYDVMNMFHGCTELRHLELNFGYNSIAHFNELCASCLRLETITLRGIEFGYVQHFSRVLAACRSLRQITLECRHIYAGQIPEILNNSLASLKVINLKGSDTQSIASVLWHAEHFKSSVIIEQ